MKDAFVNTQNVKKFTAAADRLLLHEKLDIGLAWFSEKKAWEKHSRPFGQQRIIPAAYFTSGRWQNGQPGGCGRI